MLVDAAREGHLFAELGRGGRVEENPVAGRGPRERESVERGEREREEEDETHLAKSALTDTTRPPSDVEPLRVGVCACVRVRSDGVVVCAVRRESGGAWVPSGKARGEQRQGQGRSKRSVSAPP